MTILRISILLLQTTNKQPTKPVCIWWQQSTTASWKGNLHIVNIRNMNDYEKFPNFYSTVNTFFHWTNFSFTAFVYLCRRNYYIFFVILVYLTKHYWNTTYDVLHYKWRTKKGSKYMYCTNVSIILYINVCKHAKILMFYLNLYRRYINWLLRINCYRFSVVL